MNTRLLALNQRKRLVCLFGLTLSANACGVASPASDDEGMESVGDDTTGADTGDSLTTSATSATTQGSTGNGDTMGDGDSWGDGDGDTMGGGDPPSCDTPGPNDGDTVEEGLSFSQLPDGALGPGWTQSGTGAEIVDGRLCIRPGGCARFDFPPEAYRHLTTHFTPVSTSFLRVLDGNNRLASIGAYGDQVAELASDGGSALLADWIPGTSYDLALDINQADNVINARWGQEAWQGVPFPNNAEPLVGALIFELWEEFPIQEEMLCFDDISLSLDGAP
jgi:hypothetical protein